MIVIEPSIILPPTSITESFPCLRNSFLKRFFKQINNQQSYPAVRGDLIHQIFQRILELEVFSPKEIDAIIKQAIKDQILNLYVLGKTEEIVFIELKKAVMNIMKWFDSVKNPKVDNHGIKYKHFIGCEQEFITSRYGIKGFIDATVAIKNPKPENEGGYLATAVELKTGQSQRQEYRGQVLLYSLLLKERYLNWNPNNILLYIMGSDVIADTHIVSSQNTELETLIMCRNRLAKAIKINFQEIKMPRFVRKQYPQSDNINKNKGLANQKQEDAYLDQVPQMAPKTQYEAFQLLQNKNMIEKSKRQSSVINATSNQEIDNKQCSVNQNALQRSSDKVNNKTQEDNNRGSDSEYSADIIIYQEPGQTIQRPSDQNQQFNLVQKDQVEFIQEQKEKGGVEVDWEKMQFKKKIDDIQCVSLPNMITDSRSCQQCYSKEICSLAQLSFEKEGERYPSKAGKFQTFLETEQKATYSVKKYFKTMIECTFIEEASDKERRNQQKDDANKFESNLRMLTVQECQGDAVDLYLVKNLLPSQSSDIPENSYISVKSIKNIAFSRAVVVFKFYRYGKNCIRQAGSHIVIDRDKELKEPIMKNTESYQAIYIIQIQNVRLINFNREALGGQDPVKLPWIMEVDPLHGHQYTMVRNNLAQLCLQDAHWKLKDIVINGQAPQNLDESLMKSIQEAYQQELQDLNIEQSKAVLKSLATSSFHMILGTPGSGKTQALVALVKILIQLRKKVLIVSFTNTAVDNVLVRLKQSGFTQFCRLTHNETQIDPVISDNILNSRKFTTMKQINDVLKDVHVYGCTTSQMSNVLFQALKFDYCLIDEASQINEPMTLGPLMISKKFVMIGDYYQLNPLVKSKLSKAKGFQKSLFEKLCKLHPKHVSVLYTQYRMNAEILDLSNKITYGNRMKCGSRKVAMQTIQFPQNVNSFLKWLEQIKSQSVTFLNIEFIMGQLKIRNQSANKNRNHIEAALCAIIIDNFVKSGVSTDSFRVLTPFQYQQDLLRSHLRKYGNPVVLTIDKAQGIDCDIVLFSCTRWNSGDMGQFLSDFKRLNVAVTRAKKKLIFIGSKSCLLEIQFMKQVIQHIEQNNSVIDVQKFDQDMISYLPIESHLAFNIDELAP